MPGAAPSSKTGLRNSFKPGWIVSSSQFKKDRPTAAEGQQQAQAEQNERQGVDAPQSNGAGCASANREFPMR